MPYADDEQWREYQVTPRYLAGSSGVGDPGFEPIAHWPHHYLDDGPCQLLVTSPDQRIRIGWSGDDYLLWKIAAYADPVSPPRWMATFNHTMPAEIVAGLITALAHDYAEGNDRFLAQPSAFWPEAVEPLTAVGWARTAAAHGTVEITAPDRQAGVLIDNRTHNTGTQTWTLWAGPPGWATRAEATFTVDTPPHLIAATAAAMADPTPVIRARGQIHRDVVHLVRLAPVEDPAATKTATPTPLDVRRSAVTAAVARVARDQHTELRVRAAHLRTSAPTAHHPVTAIDTETAPGQAAAVKLPPPRR